MKKIGFLTGSQFRCIFSIFNNVIQSDSWIHVELIKTSQLLCFPLLILSLHIFYTSIELLRTLFSSFKTCRLFHKNFTDVKISSQSWCKKFTDLRFLSHVDCGLPHGQSMFCCHHSTPHRTRCLLHTLRNDGKLFWALQVQLKTGRLG